MIKESVDEIKERMRVIQSKYPYLVATLDGKIVGYAYASDFRYRSAYQAKEHHIQKKWRYLKHNNYKWII